MPSWFKKVFKSSESRHGAGSASVAEVPVENPPPAPERDAPVERQVVYAPIVTSTEAPQDAASGPRIKARVEADGMSCTLLVDGPVFEGHSVWLTEAETAGNVSPLAEALFAVRGIGSVLIHDTTVALTRSYTTTRAWDSLAKEAGAALRAYLESGKPVVTPRFIENMPPENEIRQRIQTCIDLEINPGIASHSGVVALERVEGNTVYITMGGGCQGCAASAITLRQGIHNAFREAVPEVGAILDETDHAAGTNPFFTEVPEGMA